MLLSLGGHSYEIVKTHFQHVITATAINFSRLLAWLMGIPLDGTRVSRFAALAA
jgi:transposase